MKRVAILTNFTGRDTCYSLINVAETQIAMLQQAGYPLRVIVCEGFKPSGLFTEDILDYIPNVPRSNSVRPPDQEHIDLLVERLRCLLQNIDVVLTHDLIYQPASIPENMAARRIADERPDLLWLHWVHSATSPATLMQDYPELAHLKVLFPHSILVYPNAYSRPRLARNFGYPEDRIACVPHATDLADFLRAA